MSLLVAQVHCTYARYHRLLHSSVQSLLTYDFGTLRLGMCGKLKIGWDSVLRIRTVHYFDIVQTVFR